MPPLRVSAFTAVSALGDGRAAMVDAITAGRSGLRPLGPHDFGAAPMAEPLDTWVGRVDGLDRPLPARWAHWDCRNNRLAWRGLQADGFADAVAATVQRHGAGRVALVLGSSTASIGATEDACRVLDASGVFPPQPDNPALHTLHSLTGFVQEALGLQGPPLTISTACSSSAKVFAAAERLIRLGLADAAVVGGVDSLCGSVLFGFHALQLVSPEPCRPFDGARRGISIGEAAAFVLLERGAGGLQLLGHGESSDAHHLSAPDPDGAGAEAALDRALARAGLGTGDIGFLHLHGTATPKNDEVEARLVARRFPPGVPASSTKGMTGHTLGAAGALGAVFSLLALDHDLLPGTANTSSPEAGIQDRLLLAPRQQRVRTAASFAFAFGGSNCVLVFGRGDGAGS
ncbi:beta-ketoacyl-ACP synthase [Hydrogenophaga pseudoflava]|uniref:beta-ketoacyl-ACP synthase n=1 Tax=Hydrogenophaga pseudoflava TaxID=47421 RepID=UPI0027E56EA3|nr:beta-ketoacyl-ACP synthase [Hydrogenophaga pseudoflava]MDQ7747353.1 beta-ketoacyl-ACP synthase [Hydrogenophaga pseudoflava]